MSPMTSGAHDGARGTGAVVTAGIAIVILGCVAIALGLVGVPASGWLFTGGLLAVGLGAVLTRFGGSADWWPGMTTKGF